MNGFYYVIDKLRDYIKDTGFVHTVSTGDIFEIDLVKQTIYPLSHIIVNNASPKEFVSSYNISILFMDLVDISKENATDVFEGNGTLTINKNLYIKKASISCNDHWHNSNEDL